MRPGTQQLFFAVDGGGLLQLQVIQPVSPPGISDSYEQPSNNISSVQHSDKYATCGINKLISLVTRDSMMKINSTIEKLQVNAHNILMYRSDRQKTIKLPYI